MMNPYTQLYFSNDRTKAILLLLLAASVYLPFLSNPLVFDDVPFFGNVLQFADRHFDLGLRWFPYTSFGVTAVFFEGPEVFRAQNLLLHCINVLLLLLVQRLWITLLLPAQGRGTMAEWGAWLGALVFACHPLAVYGVGYLVQRSILMATMFTLLMHLAYFRGLMEGNGKYLLLAVGCYFLAVFSKEHSLMAPALLLPITWLLKNKYKASARSMLATWLGFLVVGLVLLAQVKGILGTGYEKDVGNLMESQGLLRDVPHLYPLSVLTQAGLYFKYLLLALFPNPAWMSIDMREPFILSFASWQAWVGIGAFMAYGMAGFWWLLRGGRLALLGVAFLYPWLYYFTEFSTVRVQEIFVLYRAYLWMPGLMMLFPLMFGLLRIKHIVLIATLSATVLVPMAWNRLWVFADPYRLWDDAVKLLEGEDRLGAHRIYYNRAMASMGKKQWETALPDFRKAISINSNYPEINIMLGNALVNLQRFPEAISEYDISISKLPSDAHSYYGKGVALHRLGDEQGAIVQMQLSCKYGLKVACLIVDGWSVYGQKDSKSSAVTSGESNSGRR